GGGRLAGRKGQRRGDGGVVPSRRRAAVRRGHDHQHRAVRAAAARDRDRRLPGVLVDAVGGGIKLQHARLRRRVVVEDGATGQRALERGVGRVAQGEGKGLIWLDFRVAVDQHGQRDAGLAGRNGQRAGRGGIIAGGGGRAVGRGVAHLHVAATGRGQRDG